MNSKLALFGGKKAIQTPLQRYNSIGIEELESVKSVVGNGVLSQFLGCWDQDFFGGPKVREFEQKSADYFGVKHVVTVNSWTSGLVAAIGAIGIEPGDEVIVPPWTMCASATAILHWNGIPVFCDIDPETYCLDPASVEANITPNTKAIMSVDIFGHSADMDKILKIASKHGLKVISDTAQAPGAHYKGEYAGTLADIGGYSLNYHKHIHTGEGGIIVTNDDNLAERLQLIRNHAEAVVEGKGVTDLSNMIGHNFRLGEIECAIGIQQLLKLDKLIETRQIAATHLSDVLNKLPGLNTPIVKPDCSHVYYVYPITLDLNELGLPRQSIFNALSAEGLTGLIEGYVNVHMLPLFQNKIAYGSSGFPWTSSICRRSIDYSHGICPISERLHEQNFLGYEMCLHNLSDNDTQQVIDAFVKVWENMDQLR